MQVEVWLDKSTRQLFFFEIGKGAAATYGGTRVKIGLANLTFYSEGGDELPNVPMWPRA